MNGRERRALVARLAAQVVDETEGRGEYPNYNLDYTTVAHTPGKPFYLWVWREHGGVEKLGPFQETMHNHTEHWGAGERAGVERSLRRDH
jgi:hypothetical protein